MTRVDLHPEDLFDHLRHGELRDEERARLQRHCAQCSACAFELSLVEASTHQAEPSADDLALAARAMERMWLTDDATQTAASDGSEHANSITDHDDAPVPDVRRARSHAVFRAAALLLAGVLVGGSVSAAALTGGSPLVLVDLITGWVTPGPSEPSTASAPSKSKSHKRRPKAAVRAQDLNLTLDIPSPTAAIEGADSAALPADPTLVVTEVAPIAPATASTLMATSRRVGDARGEAAMRGVAGGPAPMPPVVQTPPTDPASWLFRAASRARSIGRYQEAAALYGVLQRDYAGSETEVVARVALGRLWLGHLNDPGAALGAFESYLEARADGPLSEEARSGRVVALRRLGRETEAEQARQDLLAHHPTTLYAKTVTGTP